MNPTELSRQHLTIDKSYRWIGGRINDEPIYNLIGGIRNVGGFRFSKPDDKVLLCVLVTDGEQAEWPNVLDRQKGLFTYYGDNRSAGKDLHDTVSKGNSTLRDAFASASAGRFEDVPLFLVFEKREMNYIFRGVAVPGRPEGVADDDLIAVWKSDSSGTRFQNYKAFFTILDTGKECAVSREWIDSIKSSKTTYSPYANKAWLAYRKTGKVTALKCLPDRRPRTKDEQCPRNSLEKNLLETVTQYYEKMGRDEGPYAFERFANELCKLVSGRSVTHLEGTRRSVDGGYDGVGVWRIGTEEAHIELSFFVEAKLYKNACGVKLTQRLISRIKGGDFGFFVTTSWIGETPQREIIKDAHPVILLAGGDIARILLASGHDSPSKVHRWIQSFS